MAIEQLSRIQVGDMILRYELEKDNNKAGFSIIPAGLSIPDDAKKLCRVNSLVQVKLVGDVYPNSYAHGSSMRDSGSSNALDYKKQEIVKGDHKTEVITT